MIQYSQARYTQPGFTLIEVLIAMSLLSIMMLLLFSTMSTSVRNWDAGEQRISEVSKAATTYHFFRRHLTSIQPLFNDFSEEEDDDGGGDEEDEPEFAFQGGPESIKFVAALPASVGRMGLQVFTISLDQDEQHRGEIQVAIEPFYPVAEGKIWRENKVALIDQVETLTFTYFGIAENEQEKQWHPQWLRRQSMPELIKISISLDGGVIWPEIVVAPKIPQKNIQISAESNDDFTSEDDDDDEEIDEDRDDPDDSDQ